MKNNETIRSSLLRNQLRRSKSSSGRYAVLVAHDYFEHYLFWH